MFHCLRCMKRWLKHGKIPRTCSEPEDLTEGPAMCITHHPHGHHGSSEMIVGGALGSDGKPVRIKIELPGNVQKMLKKEQWKKGKRLKRDGETNGSQNDAVNARQSSKGGGKEEFTHVFPEEDEFFDGNDSDEGDDILDLPESLKRYILKKAIRQGSLSAASKESGTSMEKVTNAERGEEGASLSNEWSASDFTTSSLSSLASKVDSGELLKYFNSSDSFLSLSDEHSSSDSQLDVTSGSDNVSKPAKKTSSKRTVELSDVSSSDGVEMFHSGDNGTNLASTKSQRKVRNHKKIHKRRSRSFPESKDLQSSGIHLPPIQGVHSMQSIGRHYSRQRQQGKLKHTQHSTKSDEETKFGVLEGHSFHGMEQETGSVIDENAAAVSGHNEEGTVRIDGRKGMYSAQLQGHDRLAKRDRERRQAESKGSVENKNALNLPSIFNPTSTSNVMSREAVTDESEKHGRPHGQSSQAVRLPRLNEGQGIIVQQDTEGWNTTTGEAMLPHTANVTANLRGSDNSNNYLGARSSMSVPEPAMQSQQEEGERKLNSIVLDTNSGGASKSQAQFSVKDVSQSMSCARSNSIVSSAMGSTRSSVQTPSLPSEAGQKGRPSRVSQATVRQDVEISVGRTSKGRTRPPPRQRRSKQSEGMPVFRGPSENNLNKTLSSHLSERPEITHRQSMELNSFYPDDNIPRRIGHKLVKKKKGEDHQRDSVMHNSKDIGNIVKGEETANSNKSVAVQDSTSRQPSSFIPVPTMGEGSNSISQSPLSTSLKANQNFGYNSSSVDGSPAGAPGAKSRPMSGGMGSKLSSTNYPPMSMLLQENNDPSMSMPPVRLKPLDPTHTVNLDASPTTGQQSRPISSGRQEREGDGEVGGAGSNFKSTAEGGKGDEGEGLEAITEESEPSESDDDDEYFDIRPIPDLKPVSTLSFSSNKFSYFPMARPHRQAYETVRQKAVGSVQTKKWGRPQRQAKMAKRRKG